MPPWLLLAPAFAVSSPTELADPRDQDAWIVDQANVIPDADEARLNQELLAVLQDKGVEVLVATVDTVEGDPGQFGLELFRQWAPGRVNQDRGVLIVLVNDRKALAVNAGIGLMADLTDPWVQEMQATTMVPALQKGDLTGAIEAGVGAIRDRVGASTRTYAEQMGEAEPGLTDRVPFWAWLGAAGLGALGLLVMGVRLLTGSSEDETPELPEIDRDRRV